MTRIVCAPLAKVHVSRDRDRDSWPQHSVNGARLTQFYHVFQGRNPATRRRICTRRPFCSESRLYWQEASTTRRTAHTSLAVRPAALSTTVIGHWVINHSGLSWYSAGTWLDVQICPGRVVVTTTWLVLPKPVKWAVPHCWPSRLGFNGSIYVRVYAFYVFYAWWIYFPQSGALTGGTSRPVSQL